METQTWTKDGRSAVLCVRRTGKPSEPTGIVEVSIELMEQIMRELGFVRTGATLD